MKSPNFCQKAKFQSPCQSFQVVRIFFTNGHTFSSIFTQKELPCSWNVTHTGFDVQYFISNSLIATDRATETSLFDRNWATSLKLRRRSRPLRLVWWTLAPYLIWICQS
jgi:hypothetical protein